MNLELIFYKNYNLLIYSKFIITIMPEKIIKKKRDFSNTKSFNNNKNNLFDIKNESFKNDFH